VAKLGTLAIERRKEITEAIQARSRLCAFQQSRVGLHHLCFRARERKDVELTAAFLRDIGAHIVRGPQTGDWATGYYYVLFEDPDKIRLEICHVSGEDVLAKGAKFNPGSEY